MTDLVIHWFRQDLRLADNPALTAAARAGTVLPVYILDDANAGARKMGAASRVWLHHSLSALDASLGGRLVCLEGDAETLILKLARQHKARAVFWNRCYEPWRAAQDKDIAAALEEGGVECVTDNGLLLWDPWQVRKKDGTPYKVFTPFYKALLGKGAPRDPLPVSKTMDVAKRPDGSGLDHLDLLPAKPQPRWDEGMTKGWDIGERGAGAALKAFIRDGISDYKGARDFPAKDSTSRLSPRLHFGEISPVQVWHAIEFHRDRHGNDEQCQHFLRELIWREFNYSLLHHFPRLPFENFQKKFDSFPWDDSRENLAAWQRGRTGYPIVDAAMRQLWQTGYMHNRCRLIVGSFLAKHLLLNWTEGEAWFWDTLFDADNANNVCNWQWVAGTGADAAPYFRIFNPILQGEKFDRKGEYVRAFVPELARLPNKYIHRPWEAPPDILATAGITLGATYPKPVVDHAAARARALAALKRTG